MRSKILFTIIFLSFSYTALGFDQYCTDNEEKTECCKIFEEHISGVSPAECCNYPKIVTSYFSPCFNECMTNSSIEMNLRCCVVACCFKKVNIITDRPHIDGIQADGIKFSFMLSVIF